jgi:hypothetical protein
VKFVALFALYLWPLAVAGFLKLTFFTGDPLHFLTDRQPLALFIFVVNVKQKLVGIAF